MDWLSHTITGVICLIAGSISTFLLKRQSQTSVEWQTIVHDQGTRIAALEARLDVMHAEHVQCLKVQTELRTEISMLKKRKQQG